MIPALVESVPLIEAVGLRRICLKLCFDLRRCCVSSDIEFVVSVRCS